MTTTQPLDDRSNGYEAAAAAFIRARDAGPVGLKTVLDWSRLLPSGAAVLELGCGHGALARPLADRGFAVWGIDASPALAAEFRRRLPGAPLRREPVETSDFFGRRFDAVLAVGLVFLLPPEAQRDLIHKAARALEPDGRFLFTAPVQTGEWNDVLTGRRSVSLGDAAYRSIIADAGLVVAGEHVDEGKSHYYDTLVRVRERDAGG